MRVAQTEGRLQIRAACIIGRRRVNLVQFKKRRIDRIRFLFAHPQIKCNSRHDAHRHRADPSGGPAMHMTAKHTAHRTVTRDNLPEYISIFPADKLERVGSDWNVEGGMVHKNRRRPIWLGIEKTFQIIETVRTKFSLVRRVAMRIDANKSHREFVDGILHERKTGTRNAALRKSFNQRLALVAIASQHEPGNL